MAKPFYKIQTDDGIDITNLLGIKSFVFTNSVKQDNTVVLTCVFNDPLTLDSSWLVVGQELHYIFGDGFNKHSTKRICTISKIKPTFSNTIQLTIECSDKGLFMKKNSSNTTYKGTASSIVKKIIENYGMVITIDETSIKYSDIAQAGRSDYDFIIYLAERNNRIFYIKDNKAFFIQRRLDKKSIITYQWGDPNGGVKSFTPNIDHTQGSSQARTVHNRGINEKNNRIENKKGDSEQTVLGDYELLFDENSIEKGTIKKTVRKPKPNPKEEDKTGKNIILPTTQEEEVKPIIEKKINDSKLTILTATLHIDLSPNIEPDEIITVACGSKKFEGNYYIETVVHRIASQSSNTELKLKKNATNAKLSKGSPSSSNTINKTTGKPQKDATLSNQKEIEIKLFDEDANELPKSSKPIIDD